jgi:1-acyl-sn-glycerol-3-phosphate acyltransferase
MLPPRWVRRVVLAPAMVVLTVFVVSFTPGLLIIFALLTPWLPGKWRPLRILWMVLLHLVFESLILLALFALWIGSGFGAKIRTPRFERAHYWLVHTYLASIFSEAQRVLGVRVSVAGPDPHSYDGKPLLAFSRHAGPGDSFLLVHGLIDWYGREPRIVLKDTMQWDPAIDCLLNRLPTRFIDPNPGRKGRAVEAEIAQLASNLDSNDVLVLFPEGGNFTERRRARAIERLVSRGLLDEADRAVRMRNVLAPRPGGVIAALDAAASADIVWIAHTGTDHLYSVADIWRALPMDTEVKMRWWLVPASDVPLGREERIEWLFAWWARIDDWITENQPGATRAEAAQ